MSHLIVTERKDRPGSFQIAGTVPGYRRLRRNAKAQAGTGLSKGQARKLAVAEAALLEADMLKQAVYGADPNGGRDRLFADIAKEYLAFETRHPAQIARVDAVIEALGRDARASSVTQEKVDELKRTMLKTANPARNTIKTTIIMPISAVLKFGALREWCAPRSFQLRKETPEEKAAHRPKIILPFEAVRLVEAAAPHLRPVLMTMFGLGSRVSETLAIEWPNVDLQASRVSYIQKGGRWRHGVVLPPAVVAALAGLPGPRTGKVFRFPRGTRQVEYRTAQMYGGQIFTAFGRALEAADLGDRDLTPHACRHSYASWHMAVWKNPLKLKEDGGWDSLATLEIYMHLVPEGHEAAILKFWGYRAADTRLAPSIRELLLSA